MTRNFFSSRNFHKIRKRDFWSISMIDIKRASLCPNKCRQSSPELKTATLVDFCPLSLRSPAHPCDATYKIKIEFRVLTIPGRLSSDLQSIVIPVFPFCSAILCCPPPLSLSLSTPAPSLSFFKSAPISSVPG